MPLYDAKRRVAAAAAAPASVSGRRGHGASDSHVDSISHAGHGLN